jgi:hypothetical protein
MGRFQEVDLNKLVCTTCGSDEVEQRAWIQVNSKKFMDWYDESDKGCYCPNCGLDGELSTLREYKNKQEAIDEIENEE